MLNVGWSIDVECANIGAGYEAFLQKRANGESTTPEPTQEEMLAMMERVRNASKRD